jgi:uncharacterized membrane protein
LGREWEESVAVIESIPIEERVGIASFRWNIALAFTAFLTSLSLLRLHLYLATGWDLGFYEQGLWQLAAHGPTAVSSWAGYPVLARSGAWILWPLSYAYRLFGPDFLLTLQAFSYGVGFVFLMDLAEAWRVPWGSARLLGWLYWLSPIAWGAALFDFHPGFLAIPPLLAALAAAYRGRGQAALGWLILALLCQDLVTLVVVTGGLALILAGRPRLGLVALLIGVVAAAGDAAALHALDPGQWIQYSVYFGKTPWLRELAAHLRSGRTWLYLVWVLAPTLMFGVTRRSWPWLLPLIPLLALNLGSPNPATTSPFTQYAVLTLPPLAVQWLSAHQRPQWVRGWRQALAMGLFLLLFLAYLGHQSAIRHDVPPQAQNTALLTALQDVPPTAPVYCQNFVAPHVADRSVLRPILPGTVFAPGSYVVVDTGHSTGLAGLAVVRGDVLLLAHRGVTKFAEDGVYVFVTLHAVRGVS